jgi:hypothetical protein
LLSPKIGNKRRVSAFIKDKDFMISEGMKIPSALAEDMFVG